MSCDRFEAFELGCIDADAFQEHLKDCTDCQVAAAEDTALMTRIQELKEPVESPWLWSRIEAHLEEEWEAGKSHARFPVFGRMKPVFRFASVLVLGVVIGMVIFRGPGLGDVNLLTSASLKKIERREQAYVRAINALEEKADVQMAGMDVELMLLYRDRLETVEAQIAQCREALEENPGNAHIRQYMLAALRDKKETLEELL